jgi:hypothetical protein
MIEIALKNSDTERFITHVNPDVTSAVKATKGDFFRDGVVG